MHLQRQRGAGEQPDVVARLRGADRQAGEDRVLLRAVEDRVQPGAELGERARVARELAVDAVERERELEQDRAGDHPPALAGRERRPRRRSRRTTESVVTPFGVQPRSRRPARDVLRVGRDEERGEEAVVRLDGGVEQRAVLVVLADPRGGAGRRARRSAGASRTGAAGGCRRPGPRSARARRAAATGASCSAAATRRASSAALLGVELDVVRARSPLVVLRRRAPRRTAAPSPSSASLERAQRAAVAARASSGRPWRRARPASRPAAAPSTSAGEPRRPRRRRRRGRRARPSARRGTSRSAALT